ncbi:MAG: ketopantoate reductase family protein, partial [Candidatus Binataceae bacterium]
RGENLRALRERGVEITSIRGDLKLRVTATEAPRAHAPYDLVLFCVKFYQLDYAAQQLDGCLGPGGAILSLLNGVESEARLGEVFGTDSVLGGNARLGVELVAPGKIVHISTGHLEFGELDGRITDRARNYAAAFDRAGILGSLSDRIMTIRWDKLIWNSAFNTVTTLTRRTVGEVLDDPDGCGLVTALMRETLRVAQAEGALLGEDRVEAFLAHSRKNLRALKTSTQQDLERGKPLEYEALGGAVLRAARRNGIEAPITQTVYALLKLLDGSRSNLA